MEKLLSDLQNMPVDAIREMDVQQITKMLVDNIGNVNPHVRENNNSVLYKFVNEGILSDEQCAKLLQTCLDDSHLFYGIGKIEDDSVFLRSFSSLAIAFILSADSEHNFLSQEHYGNALQKSFNYMRSETDRRGYITNKGWAHSVAHGSDMLCAFIEHPKYSIESTETILELVKQHITYENRYTDGEETRLAYIIPCLIDKGLNSDTLQTWIGGLSPTSKVALYTDEFYKNVCVTHNVEYFLKSLYIMVEKKPESDNIRTHISQSLEMVWSWAM